MILLLLIEPVSKSLFSFFNDFKIDSTSFDIVLWSKNLENGFQIELLMKDQLSIFQIYGY